MADEAVPSLGETLRGLSEKVAYVEVYVDLRAFDGKSTTVGNAVQAVGVEPKGKKEPGRRVKAFGLDIAGALRMLLDTLSREDDPQPPLPGVT